MTTLALMATGSTRYFSPGSIGAYVHRTSMAMGSPKPAFAKESTYAPVEGSALYGDPFGKEGVTGKPAVYDCTTACTWVLVMFCVWVAATRAPSRVALSTTC